MKKVKRKVNRKRIIIVVLIPLICIALLIANFTSIRLSIKGYHKEDKKVVLKLEKDDIKVNWFKSQGQISDSSC